MIPFYKPERRPDGMICDAYPADDEQYRLWLTRTWVEYLPVAHMCCLNPSTAGRLNDDPSVLSMVRILRNAGYGTLLLTNPFSARTKTPTKLRMMADPVGPLNDSTILDATNCADISIMAWGSQPKLAWRFAQVSRLLEEVDLYCLGTNGDGQPRHPLYLKATTTPRLWRAGCGN